MLRETDNIMTDAPIEAGLEQLPNRVTGDNWLPALQANTAQQSGTLELAVRASSSLKYGRSHLTGSIAVEAGSSLCFRQWAQIGCGIRQRMEAISACLDDLFQNNRTPDILFSSPAICRMRDTLVGQIGAINRNSTAWAWLASTDLHIGGDGKITVIDQNLSVPTGMELLKRLIEQSETIPVSAVNDLNRWLSDSIALARNTTAESVAVVLDPCRYNSTIRENETLARTINSPIVQAGELVVRNDVVELMTGLKRTRVHTIVRRVDDDLLDPNCFRPDSLVGLPGLCKAWQNGAVDVVNPPGSSIASLRSFTRLVPTMIREYLNEEPELNTVMSEECTSDTSMQRLTENPTQFAVRTNNPLHSARPYFGDSATVKESLNMLNIVGRKPVDFVMRPLLPESAAGGFNLRVFSSMAKGFLMPFCGIGRQCQSDGGATLAINEDASAHFVG